MKRLLSFELMKIWNPLTLVYWVLFSVAFAVFSYDEPTFFKMFAGSGFRYSEDIISSIFFVASYYKYLLTLFIIYISAREFSSNTIIRSVYEGFTREELFKGKLAMLGIFVLFVFLLTRGILIVSFLMKGYSVNTIVFILFNYHFVISELFTCYLIGLLGLMLSSLTKNLYWSIGLFAICAYGEYLSQTFLFMSKLEWLTSYLPINLMINIHWMIRYNDISVLQVLYLFTLQLIFLFVVYNQYKHITWLRKR